MLNIFRAVMRWKSRISTQCYRTVSVDLKTIRFGGLDFSSTWVRQFVELASTHVIRTQMQPNASLWALHLREFQNGSLMARRTGIQFLQIGNCFRHYTSTFLTKKNNPKTVWNCTKVEQIGKLIGSVFKRRTKRLENKMSTENVN